jgi:hypothetical protein
MAQKVPPQHPWASTHGAPPQSSLLVHGSPQARSMQAQPLSTSSTRAQNPSGSQLVSTPAAQFSAVSPVGQVVNWIGSHAPMSKLQKVPVGQHVALPWSSKHGSAPSGQQTPSPTQNVPVAQQVKAVGPNGPSVVQTRSKLPPHSLQAFSQAVFACRLKPAQPTLHGSPGPPFGFASVDSRPMAVPRRAAAPPTMVRRMLRRVAPAATRFVNWSNRSCSMMDVLLCSDADVRCLPGDPDSFGVSV